MTATDLDLLQQYARQKSEAAFTAIVRRHLNLVYSEALRQVRSPQLAEEVAQSVFADLSRQSRDVARCRLAQRRDGGIGNVFNRIETYGHDETQSRFDRRHRGDDARVATARQCPGPRHRRGVAAGVGTSEPAPGGARSS